MSSWVTAAISAHFQKRIDRLGGELLDQARSGALAFGKWAEIAAVTHEDIAYQSGLTGEWSMLGVLGSAASETGEDVVVGVHEAAEQVKAAGGGFSVGLVLGLLGVGYVWLRMRR